MMKIPVDITRSYVLLCHTTLLAFYVMQLQCAIYTSLFEMDKLMTLEAAKVQLAKRFISERERKLPKIQRLLEEIESLHSEAAKEPGSYLTKPINAFTLIRRFRREWIEIDQSVADETSDSLNKDYISQIKMLRKSINYPKDVDLLGAERALLRIQEVYKLTTKQIITGEVFAGEKPAGQLSALDCLNIGLTAWEDERDLAELWQETGIQMLKSATTFPLPSDAELTLKSLEILAQIAFEHRQLNKAKEILNQVFVIDSRNTAAIRMGEAIAQQEEIYLYNSLCRGDPSIIQILPSHHAKCRYVHQDNLNLLIQPAKEETISVNPRVVLFHDIITDSEIEYLLTAASDKLETGGAKRSSDDYRTNSVAWVDIQEKDDPIWRYLRRIQDYTGLSTEANHREWIQVANYGIGGHYYPHYDGGNDLNLNDKDQRKKRIATVLTYLTDVKFGGATVFLQGRARIQPKKGTAVFWYNYLPDGNLDLSTRHAACPVVLGSKWATNLWLHESGQVFHRQCRMD